MNSYTQTVLLMTVEQLASGGGDSRSRLLEAYKSYLFKITENDFPTHLQPTWRWISKKLKEKPALEIPLKQPIIFRGSVEQSTRAMRRATASKICQAIINLSKGMPYAS